MQNEAKLNYVLCGDRYQPVILLLHGFMGDCHDFERAIASLSEFCCLAVDLPGHGQTETEQGSDYQMPLVAEALIDLLVELQIERCILVGYSMGGRIALYLAVYFPQYFYGAVLESASPGLATEPERDRRRLKDEQLAKQLESADLANFVQQWYANPLFKSFVVHPDADQAISRRLNNNPRKLAISLRNIGLGTQPSLWNSLSKIQIPLLLIVGELDRKFVEINQAIANNCHLAELKIVSGSGHNVHFEQPAKFSQLLIDFSFRLPSIANAK
ncbi:MAG: 2-succinyl-6-hydroxy-2,4-cyclohexadiene-1-carboxylate synthase [Cyanobacteria bacterium J06631_2]